MPKIIFPVPVVMKVFNNILADLDDIVGENSLKISLDRWTRVTDVVVYSPISVDEIGRIQRLAKAFGADLEHSTAEKLEKMHLGSFNMYDLSDYLVKRVKPDTAVVPLKMKRWTKVGGYWIYLCDDWIGLDDSWIDILVAKDSGFLGFVSKLYSWFFGKKISITDWQTVPGTNLIFEMWFVGDSEHSVPLLAELSDGESVKDS